MENKEIKLTDHYYTEAEIDNFISETQPFIRAIQPNEDLNAAIDDGWYTVDNSQKNIVNIPEELKNIGTYGVLEVKTYNINYKVQILFAMKDNNNSFPKIFFRKKTLGTWDSKWKKIAFTDIAKTSEFINDGDGQNNTYLTTTIIGENINNIDEKITEGWYNINYNITTKPSVLENISSWYGKLEVKKYNDNYIAQTLYTISKNNGFIRIFYRYRTGNKTENEEEPSWSDWKEVANTDALEEKENSSNKTDTWNTTTNHTRYPTEKLVKDSLDGKSDYGHPHPDLMKADPILIDAGLKNPKDLNTYEDIENIGFYYCFTNSRAKYVANTPNTMIESGETFDVDFEDSSGKSFFLLVEKGVSGNTTYIKQTLSYFNGTGTFIRMRKNNSDWTDWAQVATETSELSNNIVYQNIKEGESFDNITLSNQKLINDNINTKLGGINTELTNINSQLNNKINKDNNNATNLLLANGSNISQSTFITSSQGTGNANKNLCTGSNGNIILEEKNNHTHTNLKRTRQLNPQNNIGGNNGLDDRDLNNIIIPGWYNYEVNDAKLSIIDNIPIEDVSATLEVKQQGASNNYLTQWIYTTPDGEDITRIFYRKKYENNWSKWKEIATTSPPNPSPWDLITDISYNETNRNYTQKLWYNRLTGMAELYIRSPYITFLKSASWKRCGVLLGKSDTVYTDTQAQDKDFSVSLGQEVREYTPFVRTSGVAYLTNAGTAYNNMPIFFVLDTDGQYYFRTQKGFEFTDSQLRFEFYTTYRCKLHRN